MTIEPSPTPCQSGRCRDSLDVPGPEGQSSDVQLALDHGRVGDDLPVELEHEMDPAKRMLPVVVGESLLLPLGPERDVHERADLANLAGGQLRGGEPA